MATWDMRQIERVLERSPEVAAAYFFGSAARNEQPARDLDLLILPYPGVDTARAYFEVSRRLSEAFQLPPEQLDILVFDLGEADAEVLYKGVDEGVLLKNDFPDLLSGKIEELSSYLVANEFMLRNAKSLEEERLEAFCGTRS